MEIPDFSGPQQNFDRMTLTSLSDPDTLSVIPDLKESLVMWFNHGDLSLLQTRCMMMGRAHLAPLFLMNAYGFTETVPLPDRTKRPMMVIKHPPSFSAHQNAEILAEHKPAIFEELQTEVLPQILKTLTLGFNYQKLEQIVLVSGIGDFRVDKNLKRLIGEELGVPREIARNGLVNPSNFDTTIHLGLQPGMVKPILEPYSAGNVAGICYQTDLAKPTDYVAISASHIDSIILTVADFEILFKEHAEENYRSFELLTRDRYLFYKNNR